MKRSLTMSKFETTNQNSDTYVSPKFRVLKINLRTAILDTSPTPPPTDMEEEDVVC